MSAISRILRSKFGGVGDDEEYDDEVVKREMDENDSRTKHTIDGILGDRCECTFIYGFTPTAHYKQSRTLAILIKIIAKFLFGLLSKLIIEK